MNLHPKVKAALYAALAVAVVSVGNVLTTDYTGAWVPVVAALIPVVVGYLKSAEVDLNDLAVHAEDVYVQEDNIDGPGI